MDRDVNAARNPLSLAASCECCGLVMDRDINAVRNLLSLAASEVERLNARSGGQTRPGRACRGETRTRHPQQAGQGRGRRHVGAPAAGH